MSHVLSVTVALSLTFLLSACWPFEEKTGPTGSRAAVEATKPVTAVTSSSVKSDPDSARRLMSEADAKAKEGKLADAIALYEQVERDFPSLMDESNEISSMSFGAEAQESILPLRCQLKRPKDPEFFSAQAVQDAIQVAFSSGDPEKVAAVASCRFSAGPPESDAGGPIDPSLAAPILLKTFQGADWKGLKFNPGLSSADLSTPKGVFGLGIHVVKDAGNGKFQWAWTYVTSTNEDFLRSLWPAAK